MAYVCFNCGKKTVKGSQHRHRPGVAGRQHLRRAQRTPKSFIPNLHSASVLLDNGSFKKVLVCTKCRRFLKEIGRIKTWTKEEPKKVKVEKKAAVRVPETKKEVKEKAPKAPKTVKTAKKETVSVEELVGKKA